jgi:hypothetical protein
MIERCSDLVLGHVGCGTKHAQLHALTGNRDEFHKSANWERHTTQTFVDRFADAVRNRWVGQRALHGPAPAVLGYDTGRYEVVPQFAEEEGVAERAGVDLIGQP